MINIPKELIDKLANCYHEIKLSLSLPSIADINWKEAEEYLIEQIGINQIKTKIVK